MASVLLAFIAGCSERPPLGPPPAPLTPPTRLCGPNEGSPACRSPSDIVQLMNAELEILSMDSTPTGMQGAKVLTLRSRAPRGDTVFRAKWRPQSSADALSEPRKELAAYAVQHLFLDEEELVVPPTTAHCFVGAEYRRFEPEARHSLRGVDCVLGFLEYWLEDSQTVKSARKAGLLGPGEGVWDRRLFESDRAYRDSVSNGNLLTYLIDHGDAHDEQFVLQNSPRGLRAFVVDNSMSLGGIKNPMALFREDWSSIHVPALSAKAVSRLRQLTAADFARLGNISELALQGGTLVPIAPSEPLASDGSPISWNGSHLRIGLTPSEIELVATRVRDLLKRDDLDALTRK
ncbi:MAG TPA: hypothetical protein VHB79_06585 [Polyangiaceae bacterium]|nr:hypothetical protein [Polyangiaceae bacterium]